MNFQCESIINVDYVFEFVFFQNNTSNVQSNHKMPSNNHQSLPSNSDSTNALDDNDRVTFRGGANITQDSVNSSNSTNAQINLSNGDDDGEPIAQPIAPIHSKTKNWYSIYCNRWVSLFGAILKICIMMLVDVYYGLTCIGLVFLTWFYVYVSKTVKMTINIIRFQ